LEKPFIPKSEFFERQKKVQDEMDKNGIDLLITYSNDGAVFGQEHSRWLFNYQPHFEPVISLLPLKSELIVLSGVESEELIKASASCENIEVVDVFASPDHEFPSAEIKKFEKLLDEISEGSKIETIGIVGLNYMPVETHQKIADYFKNKKIINAEFIMTNLRAIKSQNEIKVIEYAFYIAEKGFEAAVNSINEGVSEREVAAEIEYRMRRLGSEGMGIDTMVAAGENTASALTRATFNKIKKNDLIMLTIAPRYEGYHGAVARPIIIGNVDSEVRNAIKTAISAQEAARSCLLPGNEGFKVDNAAFNVVKNNGLKDSYIYSATHSIGVSEFESPILSSNYKGLIKENMTFAIDIPIFNNSWGGFRYENGYHITKDGPRPLLTLNDEIIQL